MEEIPEAVLIALEDVRQGGLANMLSRDAVLNLIWETAERAYDDSTTYDWLFDNKDRYMEALNKMGERRSE